MKKNNLLEFLSAEPTIVEERVVDEESGEKELDVQVKFQQADVVNNNNRLYPRSILEREIEKINGKINRGESVWGLAYHPADGIGKPSDISHEWTKVRVSDEGACFGNLTILGTSKGKDIQTLVKAGKLGISSRGFGTVTEREKEIEGKKTKYFEVNEDYNMQSPGDFVLRPAVPGAFASVTEELQTLESELNKIEVKKGEEDKNVVKTENKMKESTIQKLMQMNYSRDVDSGVFRGSFEEWKRKGGELSTRIAVIEVEENLDYEEALKIVLGEEKGQEFIQKEQKKQTKVDPRDFAREAMLAGVDPIIYAQRINKTIEAEEKIETADVLTMEETKRVLADAVLGGFDVSDSDVKEKVLESARKFKKARIARRLNEEKNKDTKEAKIAKKMRRIDEKERKEKEKKSLLLREEMAAGGSNTYIKQKK